ncbi:alginate export family protein [Sphingomonas azotifigens]|uniref:alginate export family protein n=1 Tax=Sphingomonas azotifigens TaxID=330920 RepID=UPI00142F7184|nr:alginate export family protein [Sphingomonas azotifigens]
MRGFPNKGYVVRSIGLALLLASSAAQAQTKPAAPSPSGPKLSIEGSVRARAEGIDGQFRPKVDDSIAFVSLRTLVAAKLDWGDLTIGGELLDARGYGEGHNSSVKASDINTLEPLQVYASYKLHNVLGKKDSLAMTAGRFTMTFGAQRLVARADFGNTFPSYLGGRVEYRTKAKDELVLFWTHPVTALATSMDDIIGNRVQLDHVDTGTVFFGADGNLADIGHKVSVGGYVYRLAEQDRPGYQTRDRRLVTFGLRLRRAPAKGKLDVEGEAALQRGRTRLTNAVTDRTEYSVHAGFVHIEGGYTIARKWTPRISAFFDYASGDGANPGYGRFDSLYGARRADYGPASLFGPVGLANLVSPGIRIEAKPSKRFDAMVALRGLWLAERTDTFAFTNVRDKSGASGRHAGTEVEMRLRRSLIPDRLRAEIGAAYLAKGRFLTQAPNAPHTGDARYGYADLVFKF